MSTEVINGQVYQNITDLEEIDEIQNGSKLIVETPEGTRIIDWENVLIDPDHTTFDTTITQNTSDIATLSAANISNQASLTANVQNNLNKFLTVAYTLSGGSAGWLFSSIETLLPINTIQSNTVDGNFTNASSSLNGVASGSNAILLNPGSWQVSINAGFSGGEVFMDLYDQTGSSVLLTSNYAHSPNIQGLITLGARSTLNIRGYTTGNRSLGQALPFYVSQLTTTPLVATFQYLSSGAYQTVQPDVRS